MLSFEYDGRTFEVEVEKMQRSVLNIAFVDGSGFVSVYDWVSHADLSAIEMTDEDGSVKSFNGYSILKSIVAMNATEDDFWEGMRIVVVLEKPSPDEE